MANIATPAFPDHHLFNPEAHMQETGAPNVWFKFQRFATGAQERNLKKRDRLLGEIKEMKESTKSKVLDEKEYGKIANELLSNYYGLDNEQLLKAFIRTHRNQDYTTNIENFSEHLRRNYIEPIIRQNEKKFLDDFEKIWKEHCTAFYSTIYGKNGIAWEQDIHNGNENIILKCAPKLLDNDKELVKTELNFHIITDISPNSSFQVAWIVSFSILERNGKDKSTIEHLVLSRKNHTTQRVDAQHAVQKILIDAHARDTLEYYARATDLKSVHSDAPDASRFFSYTKKYGAERNADEETKIWTQTEKNRWQDQFNEIVEYHMLFEAKLRFGKHLQEQMQKKNMKIQFIRKWNRYRNVVEDSIIVKSATNNQSEIELILKTIHYYQKKRRNFADPEDDEIYCLCCIATQEYEKEKSRQVFGLKTVERAAKEVAEWVNDTINRQHDKELQYLVKTTNEIIKEMKKNFPNEEIQKNVQITEFGTFLATLTIQHSKFFIEISEDDIGKLENNNNIDGSFIYYDIMNQLHRSFLQDSTPETIAKAIAKKINPSLAANRTQTPPGQNPRPVAQARRSPIAAAANLPPPLQLSSRHGYQQPAAPAAAAAAAGPPTRNPPPPPSSPPLPPPRTPPPPEPLALGAASAAGPHTTQPQAATVLVVPSQQTAQRTTMTTTAPPARPAPPAPAARAPPSPATGAGSTVGLSTPPQAATIQDPITTAARQKQKRARSLSPIRQRLNGGLYAERSTVFGRGIGHRTDIGSDVHHPDSASSQDTKTNLFSEEGSVFHVRSTLGFQDRNEFTPLPNQMESAFILQEPNNENDTNDPQNVTLELQDLPQASPISAASSSRGSSASSSASRTSHRSSTKDEHNQTIHDAALTGDRAHLEQTIAQAAKEVQKGNSLAENNLFRHQENPLATNNSEPLIELGNDMLEKAVLQSRRNDAQSLLDNFKTNAKQRQFTGKNQKVQEGQRLV